MYSKTSLFFSFNSWYSGTLTDCLTDIYTATLSDGNLLPSFISFMPVTRKFQISPKSPDLAEGTYQIKVSSLYLSTTYSTTFKLKVICKVTSL